MSLAEDVNLEEFIMSKDDLTGADIKALSSESGLIALRERRMKVTMADFRKSKDKVLYRKKGNTCLEKKDDRASFYTTNEFYAPVFIFNTTT